MNTPNTGQPQDIIPGGPTENWDGSIDLNQVIDELLPTLHAGSRAELTTWTEADLILWADEAAKRLARMAAVFVGRSTAVTTAAGQPVYPLPDDHLSTLHVSYENTGLRGSNAAELEARDPDYRTAQGTPANWYQDLLGLSTIGVAPVPSDAQTLAIVYTGTPPALDAGKQQMRLQAPAPLKAYLALSILAEAYGRESEMEAPDIAAHCRGRLDLYQQLLTSYYGKSL